MSLKNTPATAAPLVFRPAKVASGAGAPAETSAIGGGPDESASLEAAEALAPAAPAATTPLAWALLIVLACIWGTSFILMKKGLVVFSEIGRAHV